MDNILMFVMLVMFQLIVVSLVLAIFTSVFVRSRKKGFVFLTIFVLISIYNIWNVFEFSASMGSSVLFIYVCLGVVTYFVIKKRLSDGTRI